MNFTEQLSYVVVYRKDSFWNWSAHASNHGNHFKASGQASFKYLFTLLSNKRHHIPSSFWICWCSRNKLCHLMVILILWYLNGTNSYSCADQESLSDGVQLWLLSNFDLVALWFYRGSRPVLLRDPIFLWFFRVGGSRPPNPPLDRHMHISVEISRWCKKHIIAKYR